MTAATKGKRKAGLTVRATVSRAVCFVIAASGTAGAIALAIAFNVAAVAGRGELACYAGAGLVLGAALFVHGALHMPNRAIRPILGIAAALLIYTSWTNARQNMSVISATQADQMHASIETANNLKSKRASLEARRAEQAKLAHGEAKPEAIENQIGAEKMAAGRAWSDTCAAVKRHLRDQCSQVTAKILGMKAQVEAAKERDKLTRDIEALDDKPAGIAPNATAAVGDAQNEGVFAASVELIAALAPTLLFSMLVRGGSPSEPVPAPKPSPRTAFPRSRKSVDVESSAAPEADKVAEPGAIDEWFKLNTRRKAGAKVRANAAFSAYEDWCRKLGKGAHNLSTFGATMRDDLNIEKVRASNRCFYAGFELAPAVEHHPAPVAALRLAVNNA